jgi:hypothetical protein
MGLFQWLGRLLDDLISWLGEVVKAFLQGLMWALQKVWETVIATALIAAFGAVGILYVIFYAGEVLGETVMEVWDPANYNSKPSEVFKLQQAPQNSPLPTRRSEAKVLTLENWN